MKKLYSFIALIVMLMGGGLSGNATNPSGTTDLKDLSVIFGSHNWGQWSYPWTFNGSHYAGDGDGSGASSYVDVSNFTKVTVEISNLSGTASGLRAFVWDDVNNRVVTLWFQKDDAENPDYTKSSNISETGSYSVEFGSYKYLKGIKLPYNATAEYTIDAAYCTPRTIPFGCTDLKDIKPAKGYNSAEWAGNFAEMPIHLGTKLIGDGNGDNGNKYMNVSNYESISFVVTEVTANAKPRFWMWDGTKVVTLYPHPEADYDNVNDWEAQYEVTTPGTYKVNLCGYKYLKGIKTVSGSGDLTVSVFYATPKDLPLPAVGTALNNLDAVAEHSWTPGSFPMTVGGNTTLCGDGSDNGANIASIDGYKYLLLVVDQATGNNYYRTWVANTAGQSPAIRLFPHAITEDLSNIDWTTPNAVTEPGIYVVDVENYPIFNGIKTANSWSEPYHTGTADITTVCALRSLDELNNKVIPYFGENHIVTVNGSTVTVDNFDWATAPSAPLSRYNYLKWSDATGNATVTRVADDFEGELNKSMSTVWGHGAVYNDSYADLGDLLKIEAVVSAGNPRFLFNRDETKVDDGNGGTKNAHELLTVSTGDATGKKYITSATVDGGTLYTVDIQAIKADQGYVHLQAIKGVNSGNMTFKSLKVIGSTAAVDAFKAIADDYYNAARTNAKTTLLWATTLEGTGNAIEVTNPNCIIKAYAGQVANASNVMVDGVINNLAITDGQPFALPAEATGATAASYNRSFTAAYSTVCLPFAATFTGDAYEYSNTNGTEVSFTEVDGNTLTAGKAYLVKAGFAVNGGSGIAKTPLSDAFQGVYANTKNLNGKYGFSTAGEFVHIESDEVNCPAFRAYLTVNGGASAKIRVVFSEESGIAGITTTKAENVNAYNVAGQRVSNNAKGIVIINGKKFVNK